MKKKSAIEKQSNKLLLARQEPLTVGRLIQRLKMYNPKSLVRLNVPIGQGDFNPQLALDNSRYEGDVICDRDNGDPLDKYCGVIVRSSDVVITGATRHIIQGPQLKWNGRTQNHYWRKADKKILNALRKDYDVDL